MRLFSQYILTTCCTWTGITKEERVRGDKKGQNCQLIQRGSAVDAAYDPNLNARLLFALVSSCPFDLMVVFPQLKKFLVDFFTRYPYVILSQSSFVVFPSFLFIVWLLVTLVIGVVQKSRLYFSLPSTISFSLVGQTRGAEHLRRCTPRYTNLPSTTPPLHKLN